MNDHRELINQWKSRLMDYWTKAFTSISLNMLKISN